MLDWIWDVLTSADAILLPTGDLVIRSAPGRFVGWVIGFLLLAPAAFWLWRKRIGGHLAPGAFFASFAIPLIIVPGIALEEIRVSPSRLTMTTGLWFSPTVRIFDLRNVTSIRERAVKPNQRGLDRTDLVWVLTWPDGRRATVKLSDLFGAHRRKIIDYLDGHGVRVTET